MNRFLLFIFHFGFVKCFLFAAYRKSDINLTEFPADILSSTVNLYLINTNLIDSFFKPSTFETLSKLVSISFAHNKLTIIPDFGNSKLTLVTLYMSYNNIISLTTANFKGLTSLTVIDMGNNHFTQLPEFGDSTTTLKQIKLSNNNIGTFDNRILSSYKLDNLDTLEVSGNPVLCDCKMQHFVLRMNQYPALSLGQVTCSEPAALNGTGFANVKMVDLKCKDLQMSEFTKQLTMNKKQNSYTTFPPLVSSNGATSPVECAAMCLATDGCLYFNVKKITETSHLCDVTSMTGLMTSSMESYYAGINSTEWDYYYISA